MKKLRKDHVFVNFQVAISQVARELRKLFSAIVYKTVRKE